VSFKRTLGLREIGLFNSHAWKLGTQHYMNEMKYEGDWKDDEKSGKGTAIEMRERERVFMWGY